MLTLEAARRFYAEEIRVVANLQSAVLVEALATVPREDFLGPGPWELATGDPRRPGSVVYVKTADANPRHVYHNVLIAIDRTRELNNGQPGTLAICLDVLSPQPGETVLHVGCGTGYYTALAAMMVGRSGRVVGVEIDADLAARAASSLASMPQVSVIAGDAAAGVPGACDAMLVNAGFTHPLPCWLDALNEGGRMLLPITAAMPGSPITSGAMFLVTRIADRFHARPLMPTAIFGSPSGRAADLDSVIRQAFAGGHWLRIKSVRRDVHPQEASCGIHGAEVCLSQLDAH